MSQNGHNQDALEVVSANIQTSCAKQGIELVYGCLEGEGHIPAVIYQENSSTPIEKFLTLSGKLGAAAVILGLVRLTRDDCEIAREKVMTEKNTSDKESRLQLVP